MHPPCHECLKHALGNSAIQIRQGWHNFPPKDKCQRFRSCMAASRAVHCPSTEAHIKEKILFFSQFSLFLCDSSLSFILILARLFLLTFFSLVRALRTGD